MPLRSHPSLSLPGELWQYLERIVTRFGDAWRRGEQPCIDEYLAEINGERRALLVELVHEDLACRLRAGQAARVEDYLERYPPLRGDPAVLLDLLAAEYQQRHDCGEAVAFEEYQERFGQQAADLPRRLALRRTDGNGQEQPAEAPTMAPPAPVAPAPAIATVANPAAPLPAVEGVSVPGYEVLGVLGEGGMGIVYKARHRVLGRVVALKMILHAEHAGEGLRERFQVEAQALARLQHPNIVQIHEVGEHNGRPYFALEFCPGGSLAEQLDGTPWPPAMAAALIETLAQAIHAAHRANVIHRDLKPANVLLSDDGQPKITDFGLAKKLDEAGRTTSGALVGTPSYMPPEQAGGKTKDMGPACDVYALGAILYELLTGRPPFKAGDSLDTVLQVLSDEPVSVRRLQPKVPRDLETVCHKCLEKDPKKRYASAEGLAEDLRRFQAGESVTARPVGVAGRSWRWCRRNRGVAGLLAALAASLLIGIILSSSFALKARAGARETEKQRAIVLRFVNSLRQFPELRTLSDEHIIARFRDENPDLSGNELRRAFLQETSFNPMVFGD